MWGVLALAATAALALVAIPRQEAGAAPLQVTATPSPYRLGAELRRLALLGQPASLDSAVFPVEVRRIVIDPGHGGPDGGTAIPGGLEEKEIALDIAVRLRDLLLAETGWEVLLTRQSDRYVVLRERAQFANDAKADLFLSIHVNWLEPRSTRAVETFYLGPTQDPYLVQLTSRENRESGYSLADVRRLLDRIYLDLRQQESEQLAGDVQRALFESLSDGSPVLRNRGIKAAPFLVLVATQMPAILAEVSCLSNEEEARRLAEKDYRQAIAEALFQGVRGYANSLSHSESRGS